MRKTRYEIFPGVKIIVEYLSGNIDWSDYLEMKKQELSDPNYKPNFNVITDIRDVKNDKEDLEGIENYVNFLNGNTSAIGQRKTAILTDSSKQVVHSEILKHMIDNLPMDLKTVSTYHAAFEWTGLNYTARGELCHYLEQLRMNSFAVAASA